MKFCISLAVVVLLWTASAFAEYKLLFGKPEDPIAGISARVLAEAYKRIDIDIEFVELPAERSLLQSNGGVLDGEVNRVVGIDQTYANLIRIPVPVNYFESVVFTKTQQFTVNGWDSLKPYSIAIRIGAKFAENRTKGMEVGKFVTYDKVFMLVSKSRFDICITSRITGLYQINKHNLVGVKALEPPLETFHLYHYLNKKHELLVPMITASLHKMEQEGAILKERERFIAELLKPD